MADGVVGARCDASHRGRVARSTQVHRRKVVVA